MLDAITSAFSRKNRTGDLSHLPAHVRNEILDAMDATSKTDIR